MLKTCRKIVRKRPEMKDLSLAKCCLLIPFLVWTSNSQPQPGVIQTSCGRIKGSLLNVNCRRVYQYLGIPYAEPPVGDLRFKKPKPIRPWSQTLIANKMPPACIQYALYRFPWRDTQRNKSEDCLYLNIWVPNTQNKNCYKSKMPVMFWIHGGIFSYGSIRKPEYDGRTLAAEGGVIVVTINYRLGAFGFFTTNTDDAPLNVGMYDMVEALKWVNKNIDAFGGDPNQVTIFGEGSGSIAVGLFCISPMTKGLFKRAIMESGSPATVLFNVNTANVEISQELAGVLGCSNTPVDFIAFPDKVADCMRKKDKWEIAKALNSFYPETGFAYLPEFGDEFLPENPRITLTAGKIHDVEVLIGNNRDEGSMLITSASPQLLGIRGRKIPEMDTSAARNLFTSAFEKYFEDSFPDTKLLVQNVMRKLITGDYRKDLKPVYDFLGDFDVVCPAVYMAETLSRFQRDTYFYFFTYEPEKKYYAKWMGVAHFCEVPFVFGCPVRCKNLCSEKDANMSKTMMRMWSTFAKTGYPLPDKSKKSKRTKRSLLPNDPNLEKPTNGSLFPRDLNLKKWPKYSREMPVYMILDENTMKAPQFGLGPHTVNCNLLRPIMGYL